MVKILFDITPLIEGALNKVERTGIYFCTKNIFNELQFREDVCLEVYCKPKVIFMAEKEIRIDLMLY